MSLSVSTTELTPLMFLERSASVYPGRTAIVYNRVVTTYADMAAAATRLANALATSGVRPGDRVAYLCPNIPEMLIAHFGVPLAQAVLVAINTRLAPDEIAYILNHSGATRLVGDTALLAKLEPVLDQLTTLSEIVSIDDGAGRVGFETTPYPDFLERGSAEPLPWRVDSEFQPISINYTSGTTGRPKGVLYSHRGAYLNALGEIIHSQHSPDSVYLWTLPMFHCNGWCTTWALPAIGGTSVCLRAVDSGEIWRLIREHGVTHLNAAPTVLIGMANHADAAPLDGPLVITTAGAPPSPTLIAQLEDLGARIVHMYGLTETYGPHTVCEWQPEWGEMAPAERSRMMSRQGVPFIGVDPIRVVDDSMRDVARNGEHLGEVVMRGNNVMLGYYDDPEATERAFAGGYFHSGDVGVWHEDGYIELRDRSKDIIISGGENISTIEVEQTLASHDSVLEAAIVAVPHEKWGERPKAFVVLKDGREASESELIDHVRSRLAHYKAPDSVEILDQLPKTSTGKIQKYLLREKEWSGYESRIN